MITQGRLEIFRSFRKIQRKSPNENTGDNEPREGWGNLTIRDSASVIMNGTSMSGSSPFLKGFLNKLEHRWRTYSFSPKKFFKKVKAQFKELKGEDFEIQELNWEPLYAAAKTSQQTALMETLEDEKERIEKEIELIKMGYPVFLEEEDAVQIIKRNKGYRSIRLDWIANFCRLIPTAVRVQLQKVEETRIFDNYVVMHYDPKNIASKKTREEAKDPILFGVMECSNRLYFIADWIDEYCDITLRDALSMLQLSVDDRLLGPNNLSKKLVEKKEEPEENKKGEEDGDKD